MLERTGWVSVAAALLAWAPIALAAQPADRALAADMDSLARRIMAASGISGLSIAVVHGDRPVLVKGYGFADQLRVELESGMGKVVTFRFAEGRATAMVLDRLEYVRK